MKEDLYIRVTERIIRDLESGVAPWVKPWKVGNLAGRAMLPLRHNGEPYHGVNILVLWMRTVESGFNSPFWMTYKQAKELGGQVRKGEYGETVFYANKVVKPDINSAGDDVTRTFSFLRSYSVFNVCQIDNLPDRYTVADPVEPSSIIERIAVADEFFAATGAKIQIGGNKACYIPSLNLVQMPPIETFQSPERHASTLGHELIHWTGHEKRLAREFKQRGTDTYAKEELVAEMGAAFLCAYLGISAEPRPDHAEYIAFYLKVLKDDKRFIFSAAAHAQRAMDYLIKAAGKAVPDTAEEMAA